MTISVSLINMKGGVGKTTLAAQLAQATARRGLRTLAVDLDPQGNLSQALLSPERYARHLREKRPTVIQIFDQYIPPTAGSSSPLQVDISAIIVREAGFRGWRPGVPRTHARANLHLIVRQLELAHILEDPPRGTERRLAEVLAKVSDHYDLILIDCAPTESILTKAAYHASRYVLVPVKPEYLATIGLPLLARSVQTFKDKNAHHSLDICGVVFNNSGSYSLGPEERRSIREVMSEAEARGWPVFEAQLQKSKSYPKPHGRAQLSDQQVMCEGTGR